VSGDLVKYEKHYSEDGFWKKLGKFALKIGRGLVEKALQLYYVIKDSNAPVWAKATAVGALGYLISPIDLIPDIIPFVGYSDDAGAIASALIALNTYITPEIKKKAQKKLMDWFG